jgi:hypothetical protein
MDYRRLQPAHIPAILALQETNLLGSGGPSPGGFLSARLGAEQFLAIAQDLAVIVAAADADIAGYLCAAHDAPSRSIPILAAMLDELPRLSFLGRTLGAQRTFVYGPVCVAERWRGQGVLRGMYNALRREIAGDFDAGVLFVAKDNPHSLHAHADGLGMTLVGDFAFDRRSYWILAFPVPLPAHC